MSILKQHLAPITEGGWAEINEQAKRTLSANLSARRLVDIVGPLGWEAAAVNLGRQDVQEGGPVAGVRWGIRNVQPLIELRTAFELNIWDLDDVDRGSKVPDLDSLEEAALKTATFEEQCIYLGCEQAGISGLLASSGHDKLPLGENIDDMLVNIETALFRLHTSGVEGPYALVLGGQPYRELLSGAPGCFPIRQRVLDLLGGGGIYWSPALQQGLVVSTRGGDFELTLGVDTSIGYESHTTEMVQLYFTESFTFRVLEPKAVIAFT